VTQVDQGDQRSVGEDQIVLRSSARQLLVLAAASLVRCGPANSSIKGPSYTRKMPVKAAWDKAHGCIPSSSHTRNPCSPLHITPRSLPHAGYGRPWSASAAAVARTKARGLSNMMLWPQSGIETTDTPASESASVPGSGLSASGRR
jgi:hypothetical protein